jgi:deoxycytidylate deaminase
MLTRYVKFARIAFRLALESDTDIKHHKLCALVVNRNRVISVGYNSRKTHPAARNTKMSMIHAEQDAILRASDVDLMGADIYVARARRSGLPGLAKPCPVCDEFIRRKGIRRVIYTTNSSDTEFPKIRVEKIR